MSFTKMTHEIILSRERSIADRAGDLEADVDAEMTV
jgi:hypothetical protein